MMKSKNEQLGGQPPKRVHRSKARVFFRENGLSLAMFMLFAIFLIGQSIAGHLQFNDEQRQHGLAAWSFGRYLTSGEFIEAVFENWESEFLQMGLYVILTGLLYQRGSAESKNLSGGNDVDQEPVATTKSPRPVWKGGLTLKAYQYSLSIALLTLFALSFVLHAVGGAMEYVEEHPANGDSISLTLGYMRTSKFWFESFQNWQSEFLSVGVVIVLSVFLRQKGSPDSKPVAAPNDEEAA
jgi:hypothetical protein